VKEFDLIQLLTRSLPSSPNVVTGPGDDCAVLDLGLPGDFMLFKTDAVVEGVHFTSATPGEKIGRKALGRVLSDIAAMAGTPSAALVTLGLPAHYEVATVDAV
jgi:thiamine-monophosphate kinase